MKNSKETKIKKRTAELIEIYEELPEEKMKIVLPLIQNAAFLEVELEYLRNEIASGGATDEYRNSEKQYGRKVAANVQAFNNMMKTYNMVNTRLETFLPAKQKNSKLDELINE